MKSFLLTLTALSILTSVSAFAAQSFLCAARDSGADEIKSMEITLTATTLNYVTLSTDGDSTEGTASRDKRFEAKYPQHSQMRLVDDNPTKSPFVSDQDVSFFADKAMLEGRPGKVTVTTSQANDAESGGYLIFSPDIFDCVAR